MKRCRYCGREGSRMVPAKDLAWMVNPFPPKAWKCAHPIACIRRQERLGQWHGKRVLYRQDADGTRWTIRRLPGTSGSPVYTLMCEYRQHRVTSSHFSIDAAKAHADDMTASMTSRSMREYAGRRV